MGGRYLPGSRSLQWPGSSGGAIPARPTGLHDLLHWSVRCREVDDRQRAPRQAPRDRRSLGDAARWRPGPGASLVRARFSKEHRDINIRRIGYVASTITKHGGLAICAPDRSVRPRAQGRPQGDRSPRWVRAGARRHSARDLRTAHRKGLYAKARAGLLPEFTGISDPYEPPDDAEVVIDTRPRRRRKPRSRSSCTSRRRLYRCPLELSAVAACHSDDRRPSAGRCPFRLVACGWAGFPSCRRGRLWSATHSSTSRQRRHRWTSSCSIPDMSSPRVRATDRRADLRAYGSAKAAQAAADAVFLPASDGRESSTARSPAHRGTRHRRPRPVPPLPLEFRSWTRTTGMEPSQQISEYARDARRRAHFEQRVVAPILRWWLRSESQGRDLSPGHAEARNQCGTIVNGTSWRRAPCSARSPATARGLRFRPRQ